MRPVLLNVMLPVWLALIPLFGGYALVVYMEWAMARLVLPSRQRRVLWGVAAANAISTVLGIPLAALIERHPQPAVLVVFGCFVLSVAIEYPLCRWLWPETRPPSIFRAALWMNILTYALVAVIAILASL
jgi:uncharacterized membrane protein YfcA